MKYLLSIVILLIGYYTVTYGISLWKRQYKSGSIGVLVLTGLATLGSIVFVFLKFSF